MLRLARRSLLKMKEPWHVANTAQHIGLWIAADFIQKNYVNPKFKAPKESKEADAAGIGVYCVHGTADREGAFAPIAQEICVKLPESISSIHLVSFQKRFRGKGIDFFAGELLREIRKNRHKRVILCGHSRGGLIVSAFAENFSKLAGIEVLGVFNICAPFGGSGESH
jgi:pimeloyl-ACP methyl ester carboxylesterase